MPRVHLFLRDVFEISEMLYVKSMHITSKRELSIDLAADCYPSAGSSYRLNQAQRICRLIIHFDKCEGIEHLNGLVVRDGQKWIPVEEKLPEYNETVLAYVKSPDWERGKIVIGCRTHTDINGEHWAVDYVHYLTHWMPLPAPPEDKN